MRSFRRYIPPLVLIGGAAAASVFASLLVARLRSRQQGAQKAALDNWEGEGGCVAAGKLAAPSS